MAARAAPVWPPLLVAVRENNLAVVQRLVAQGADASTVSVDTKAEGSALPPSYWPGLHEGMTAALVAAELGHLPMLQWLLDSAGGGVDYFSQRDKAGTTPFLFAVGNGHVETAAWLVQQFSTLGDHNTKGSSAIHYAAMAGQLEVLRWLCDKHNVHLDTTNDKDSTAIHFAAFCGHMETLQWLVARGANVRAVTVDRSSALHFATLEEHIEIVTWLLDNGHSRIDERDMQEATALLLAAFTGNVALIERLIQKGASLADRDQEGASVLLQAVCRDKLAVLEWLAASGHHIDWNEANTHGFTALMFSSNMGHKDSLHFLLQQPLDVDAVDHAGRTALFWCARNNIMSSILALLRAGADPLLRCHWMQGYSALQQAHARRHMQAWSVMGLVVAMRMMLPMLLASRRLQRAGRLPRIPTTVWQLLCEDFVHPLVLASNESEELDPGSSASEDSEFEDIFDDDDDEMAEGIN